ncbi:Hemolysin activation/secretion protein [Maridesulfovibrio ferrireducens]|uniref:Hemolysin activation/secretion protein n=1 Tax=Maridesulfovibrio ferrireducens TaxID=246191 RepID=A0A1G9EPZ8_9BACT|nr:ShlB/FhaC/HecB family hemolysin secretion/activation protein [Maridesulfovibrio ferrireducens]SDK78200.1 Hemolysin activation/secretion protein [Maridesulfovibrio ferrireducens]
MIFKAKLYLFFFVFILFVSTSFSYAEMIPIPSQDRIDNLDRVFEVPDPKSSPELVFPEMRGTEAPPSVEGMIIFLNRIEITGNTVFTTEELLAPYKHLFNTKVPAKRIFEISQELTVKYGKAGYVLSNVVVPRQDVDEEDAVVKLIVTEGYVDNVDYDGDKDLLEKMKDRLESAENEIISSKPASVRKVIRALLILRDIPGLKLSSTLAASKSNSGAANLTIRIEQKSIGGSAKVDNRGTDSAGPVQYTASFNVNGLTGVGSQDRLTYRQADEAKEYLNVFYEHSHLLESGLRLYGSFAYGLSDELDNEFTRVFKYNSNSETLKLGLSYPILRQREENLSFEFDFESRNSYSYILSETNSKDRVRKLRAGFNWDMIDSSGGMNQVLGGLTTGIDAFGATNYSSSSSRSNVSANFFKFNLYASRTQSLPYNFSIYAAVDSQWAESPLYSGEEFAVGGVGFGRAYDSGAITGEVGCSAISEIRKNFQLHKTITIQPYTFVDWGWVKNVQPSAGTPKEADLSSFGAGMRFYPSIPSMLGDDRIYVDIQWARPTASVQGSHLVDKLFFNFTYSF